MASVAIAVTNLSVLGTGDHIEWERRAGYAHHAIVEWVDYKRRWPEVHVIEYGSDNRGSGKGKGVIRRRTVHNAERMKKHEYIHNYECFDRNEVSRRARSRIGEREYGVLGNNCEHFARWCKTGNSTCSQIPAFKSKARGVVGSSECTAVGRCIARCAVEAATDGTSTLATPTNLLQSGGSKIWNAVATGGKEIGKNALKSTCIAAITGGVTVLFEAGLFGYNCYKIHQKYGALTRREENYKKKQSYRQEERKEIKKAGFESLGGAIGATIGATIGGFIPVFGTVFSVVGALLGNVAGRKIGRWLS